MNPKSAFENAMKEPVQCPFCLGYETELYALFGQWLSTSQYYCRSCRTVFEWIKWEGEGAALTPPDGTPLP